MMQFAFLLNMNKVFNNDRHPPLCHLIFLWGWSHYLKDTNLRRLDPRAGLALQRYSYNGRGTFCSGGSPLPYHSTSNQLTFTHWRGGYARGLRLRLSDSSQNGDNKYNLGWLVNMIKALKSPIGNFKFRDIRTLNVFSSRDYRMRSWFSTIVSISQSNRLV